ncbi:Peptidoglycan/LPS O-acetylase OafA/YrhL, contains acyltransferase and SGNH-hydrolase domains [Microbacterium sp. ru370.1]|uniref:acyltransferase family protein n=1 Tax=unclassified Microbacterium TaxID=2609290 RepID=UPI00088CDECD|nr:MULTISPECIES: acyltransferase family protein [unclassified Microbacterium]SDO52546.1 Peptidoglycan/LPS O-acetylase OafA/YrhL, contains acyltransferase and SGNH-hydrolase domains [Microbacterium sp. ru370.1]SIT83889.1 Peptidoglycan/LPS O-acetylase OafA/YrhL, contains acyltransferase and SGNH-hydrolase domains [Microbacterium sp. RU1D]
MRLTLRQPTRPSVDGRAVAGRWAYRADVDGLRAVAILLVVTYHVWFGRVSGGVDVFLMLSAFFLTRGFVRRMAGPDPVRPLPHLLGIFRRLLPAAAVTLAGVLALVWIAYPPTAWRALWDQTWASLAYVQNGVLAADAVDYYARTEIPSPLQHFWSMSVQGQAFVLWVVLLGLCQLIVRRRGLSPDRVVGVVFGVVFAVSFAYSIARTATAQELAYFDTGARLWEFAAGSLLVVALPHVRVGALARAVLGWAGLAGLLILGAVLDVRGGFPGFLALWPVLCAAAIVVSGSGDDGGRGPARLLSSRPLQAVGRDAYALYLVHWPILVTFLVVNDRTEVGLVGGAAIIALSLLLARALTWAVDRPVRAWRRTDSSPLVPVAVVAVAASVVAVPLGSWQVSTWAQERAIEAQALRDNPGAAVLRDPSLAEIPADAELLPLPTLLDDEWVQLENPCAGRWSVDTEILLGTCFETSRTARAGFTIAVIGDSHAQQLTGALLPVAEENGWGVVSLIKGGCSMGLAEPGMDERCDAWREEAIDLVERVVPDAVLTVVTRSDAGEDDEVLRPGIEVFLDRMGDAGIPVLAVRDNPRFAFDMYGCVIAADDPLECATPRAASLADENPAAVLERPGVDLLDLTPWICPDDLCVGVVGNVVVYRDDNHLSRTYARTLGPSLAEQLPSSLG